MKTILTITICICFVQSVFSQQVVENIYEYKTRYGKEFYYKDVELDSNMSDLLMFNFFVYFASRGFSSTMHLFGVDVFGNRVDDRMNFRAILEYRNKTLSVRFDYSSKDLVWDPETNKIYSPHKEYFPTYMKDSINSFYDGAKNVMKEFFDESKNGYEYGVVLEMF